MSMTRIERDLRREFFVCPFCGADVHTVAAEGVPGQTLRTGDCGHDFFIDPDSSPRYEPG